MADAKPKKVTRTTPAGLFIYPKLCTPDIKFKAAGEFSVKLSLPTSLEYTQKLRALIDKTADEALAEAIKSDTRDAGKKKASPWKLNDSKPYADEMDKEGNPTGNTVFKFGCMASGIYKKGPKTGQTWTRTIKMFDAKGTPLPTKKKKNEDGSVTETSLCNPWGGTIGCVEYEVRPYGMTAKVGAGCVLGLESVMIKKLVKGGDLSAVDRGFETDEDDGGFSVDELGDDETTTKASTGDAKATVAGATEDDF